MDAPAFIPFHPNWNTHYLEKIIEKWQKACYSIFISEKANPAKVGDAKPSGLPLNKEKILRKWIVQHHLFFGRHPEEVKPGAWACREQSIVQPTRTMILQQILGRFEKLGFQKKSEEIPEFWKTGSKHHTVKIARLPGDNEAPSRNWRGFCIGSKK